MGSVFLYILGWDISHSKKNRAKYYDKCTNVFTYSTRYSCQISIKLAFYGNTFEKYSNINNLLHYSCYNAPTCFDATAPSSGGSCPVAAKLYKHLNAELVIFLKLYICYIVKI
jgi:hypothetical protein